MASSCFLFTFFKCNGNIRVLRITNSRKDIMKKYPKPEIIKGDFWEVINDAIKKERHVDYLKQVIKDFESYKEFFAKDAFVDFNPRGYIYQFKVTYNRQSRTWRIIEMKGNQTFEDFAEGIIESMDWVNDHMHRFAFPGLKQKNWQFTRSRYEIFCDAEDWDDDPYPTMKTNQIRIDDINYEKYPKLLFEFDFGDSHEFYVEMIKIRGPKIREVKSSFPRIIKEVGNPPEQYPDYDEEDEEPDPDEFVPIAKDKAFQKLAKMFVNKKVDYNEGEYLKEYFAFHDQLPKNITQKHIKEAVDILDSNEQDKGLLKYAIIVLAHAGTKEALKALKSFSEKAKDELVFWANTAVGECAMFIDADKEEPPKK